MSILDNMASALANNKPAANTAGKSQRKPAEYWINVGIELPNGQFIKLPYNLPLDDMNKLELRGQNQEWLQEAQARNMLLDVLKHQASSLPQGESRVLGELKVQLFRRSADASVDIDENPLMAALMQALNK